MKTIMIGEGLGDLRFGMSREEVKALLGEADEVSEFSYTDTDEDLTESWHYDDLELSLSFDEEDDWLLSAIAVNGDDYLLEGKKLMGFPRAQVLDEVAKMGLGEMELEDMSSAEAPDLILVTLEDSDLSLWFDEGVLTEILWGPTEY